jgi:archaellum biogenesis protein FlaJ (TadC family)
MIQRIQTIYLFLATLSVIGLFFLPLATSAAAVPSSPIFNDGIFSVKEYLGIAPLFGAAGMLAFIAIFLYSNRMLQKVMILVVALLVVIGAVLLGYIFASDEWAKTNINQLKDQYGLGLPVFTLIFLALATRYINKDEKLVRSMDRLR